MIAFVFRVFVLSLAAVVVWFLFDFSWQDSELRVQYRFSKPAERIRGFIAEEKERLGAEERLPVPVLRSADSDGDAPPLPQVRTTELRKPPVESEQTASPDAGPEPKPVQDRTDKPSEEVIPEASRREIEKLIRESM